MNGSTATPLLGKLAIAPAELDRKKHFRGFRVTAINAAKQAEGETRMIEEYSATPTAPGKAHLDRHADAYVIKKRYEEVVCLVDFDLDLAFDKVKACEGISMSDYEIWSLWTQGLTAIGTISAQVNPSRGNVVSAPLGESLREHIVAEYKRQKTEDQPKD